MSDHDDHADGTRTPQPALPIPAPDPEAPEKLRLGGMALRNGLLVHGPTHWAAAVRAPDGTIQSASGTKPRLRGVESIPGVRGVVRLAESMVVIPLVLRDLPAARLPFQDARIGAAALGASFVGSLLRRLVGGSGGDAVAMGVSVLPALLTLSSGEVAAYHGVEHKSIAAYEQDREDAVVEVPKEHDRCGSHLVTPMLAANLLGTGLVRRFAHRPGPIHAAAVSLGATAAAVEIFLWCERHPDTAVTRLLRRPGHELQRLLGTREPDDRQLAVGRAAMGEILRAEQVA